MLLMTIQGLSDQQVAERMRAIAARMTPSRQLIEMAADEAVAVYQRVHRLQDAIDAGVQFVQATAASTDTSGSSPPAVWRADRAVSLRRNSVLPPPGRCAAALRLIIGYGCGHGNSNEGAPGQGVPFAWVESWWFIGTMLLVSAALAALFQFPEVFS